MNTSIVSHRSVNRAERFAAIWMLVTHPIIVMTAAIAAYGTMSNMLFVLTFILMPIVLFATQYARRVSIKLGLQGWKLDFFISISASLVTLNLMRTQVWADYHVLSMMSVMLMVLSTFWSHSLFKLIHSRDEEAAAG